MKLPASPADPSSAAFRKDFAAIARGGVFDRLARIVVTHGFFWDRDFANGFDPKRSGVENLAAAVGLERGTGGGWQALAAFADEPTASETPASPGVLCAPGRPEFDSDDFDRLTDATRTNPSEWVFPRADGLDVRAGHGPRAPWSRSSASISCTSCGSRLRPECGAGPHGLGADRDSERQDRLRSARHADVAVGGKALLHQGHHRPLADHGLYRPTRLNAICGSPPHRCRNSTLRQRPFIEPEGFSDAPSPDDLDPCIGCVGKRRLVHVRTRFSATACPAGPAAAGRAHQTL